MRPSARSVVLALGSNLGDRLDILQGGVDAIAGIPEVRVMAVSPVYETVPAGGPPQPDYLNAVLLARTTLASRTLLDRLHQVEAAFDRVRMVRWGPRTLDIDIISVAGEVSADPEITLPHPRAHERAFVLAPWHDVDPDAVLPGHGLVTALLAGTDRSGIRRSPAALLAPGRRLPGDPAVLAPGEQTSRMGGSRPPYPPAPGDPPHGGAARPSVSPRPLGEET